MDIIFTLVNMLKSDKFAAIAEHALSRTLLVFDAFHDVEELANQGNEHAKRVMQAWADALWFTERPQLPEKVTLTVYKVPGETNTDDLSPATVLVTSRHSFACPVDAGISTRGL